MHWWCTIRVGRRRALCFWGGKGGIESRSPGDLCLRWDVAGRGGSEVKRLEDEMTVRDKYQNPHLKMQTGVFRPTTVLPSQKDTGRVTPTCTKVHFMHPPSIKSKTPSLIQCTYLIQQRGAGKLNTQPHSY